MIRKFFSRAVNRLKDPARSFKERVFILLTLVTDFFVFLALICDIVFKENKVEIITLIITVIMVPVITIISIRRNRVNIAVRIIVVSLVVILLPVLFYFGGGVNGGGVIWIIFTYLYTGLVVSGKWKPFFLIVLTIETVGFYLDGYFWPHMVVENSAEVNYFDSMMSIILVGIICCLMVWFEEWLFMEENKRAKEETKKVEELNRAQNRFFSSMSHEIRTPINSILGLNEVILNQSDASDEIIRDATNIQGAGRMLLALINDILDFSKIEAGAMDIVPIDYKVADLMSEIVNMVWLRAHEKGLEFEVDIDPKIPSVLFGDEVRIKQIIINLLNNAIKYTQSGSVGLHVESEKMGEDEVQLIISVSDTGMGIRQEVIPNLFDAFKRVDQEKNRNIEGTGLGLSIVKMLTDLMGGDVSVSSVYGQGSTFTVSLKQKITNPNVVGNINISNNSGVIERHGFDHMFVAPKAKILIVDDNEMNLEVEKKLLSGTELTIDTAVSGAEALRYTLENRYDVILMDHLMPQMDGIECLDAVRKQTGGLNVDVPVIVLTANAGSENRELYNNSGFDGYLVKPVSGHQLEEMLLRHIPQEKLIVNKSVQMNAEEMNTAQGYARKQPVAFASSSLCDIPEILIRKLDIHILTHSVITDEGVFRDNIELTADETIRYMETGKDAKSVPRDVSSYIEFFGKLLRRSHHVIYIALTTSMSDDYDSALKASRSFENVTVINSESMSSCLAMMLMIGYKLAQQNMPVDKIIAELEENKKRMRASFIMGTTEYMARKGLVGKRVNRIANALDLRPSLRYKNDKYSISGAWMGSIHRCYEKYIRKTLSTSADIDTELAFVTYVSVPEEELVWIEEQINKRVKFDHIIFQQASAGIASNSGPGTFGILYMEKGSRSYNLSSIIQKELSDKTEVNEPKIKYDRKTDESNEALKAKAEDTAAKEPAWYEKIEGIDSESAIKSSGSEDTYKNILKMFYEAIPQKSAEISGYYEAENWQDYTIKVHALKSSAKLIGAKEFAEEAQQLENAGKAEDIDYIRSNHNAFMNKYAGFRERLSVLFTDDADSNLETKKKTAPKEVMEAVLEEIRSAAEAMDCDRIESVFDEMKEYSIPENDRALYDNLKAAFDRFDYEEILSLLAK